MRYGLLSASYEKGARDRRAEDFPLFGEVPNEWGREDGRFISHRFVGEHFPKPDLHGLLIGRLAAATQPGFQLLDGNLVRHDRLIDGNFQHASGSRRAIEKCRLLERLQA